MEREVRLFYNSHWQNSKSVMQNAMVSGDSNFASKPFKFNISYIIVLISQGRLETYEIS
jgi:hypothetical protein